MKTFSHLHVISTIFALTGIVFSGHAAPATNSSRSAAVPNDAVPKSVFTVPKSRKDGCDPFFPDSTRMWEMAPGTAKPAKPVGLDCLVLNGLSGTAQERLAIISGRTMSRGENAEIVTSCGRISVHCVDVTTNSAIIEVGGQQRELRLRSDL